LTFSNIMTMKSRLRVTHPANVCTVCRSLKSTVLPGCLLPLILCVYLHLLLHSEPKKKQYNLRWCMRHDRSRSFKVIEIGTTRKPVCNFLLVFRYNRVHIFYMTYITTYWSNISVFFAVFTCPSHLKPSQLGFPGNL